MPFRKSMSSDEVVVYGYSAPETRSPPASRMGTSATTPAVGGWRHARMPLERRAGERSGRPDDALTAWLRARTTAQ